MGHYSAVMRVGVVVFPGSCDDRDAAQALAAMGIEPVALWHADADLRSVDAVVLPGGFSYGDYLRAGAIARFAPAVGAVVDFARRGGPVLGVCNGFQVLCEAGLLPGVLTRNERLRFLHRPQHVRLEVGAQRGTVLLIPTKHGEGRYVHPEPARLADAGQVLMRYCTADGRSDPEANPNGSVDDIAGITNSAGNVIGLMPHPEHAVDPLLGSADGRVILAHAFASTVAR
jgi:phosphoribosylformylglycinamidine synthase I